MTQQLPLLRHCTAWLDTRHGNDYSCSLPITLKVTTASLIKMWFSFLQYATFIALIFTFDFYFHFIKEHQTFSNTAFFFSRSFIFVFAFVTNKSPDSNINLSFFFGFAKIFHSFSIQATRHKTNISLTRAVMIVDRIPKNLVVNLEARCCFTAGSEVWPDGCSLPRKLFGVNITRK